MTKSGLVQQCKVDLTFENQSFHHIRIKGERLRIIYFQRCRKSSKVCLCFKTCSKLGIEGKVFP